MTEIAASPTEYGTMLAGRELRSELPFLRRFARALVGKQQVADLAVVELMENLLADIEFLRDATTPKIALYRQLILIIETLSSQSVDGSASALPTTRGRQAHLLTAVEGFTAESAAEVLGITSPEFTSVLSSAKAEIARSAPADIMIIEDDRFMGLDLEWIACSLGHNVTGILRSQSEAIAHFKRQQPGLILSDVCLSDGSSGIDAVDEILTGIDIPVIFITAHPELLLTGKRSEPAFVITKPFKLAAVEATISHALFLSRLFSGVCKPVRAPKPSHAI